VWMAATLKKRKEASNRGGASGRLHHALMLHHSLVEVDKNSAYNPNLMIICGIYVTSYLAIFWWLQHSRFIVLNAGRADIPGGLDSSTCTIPTRDMWPESGFKG